MLRSVSLDAEADRGKDEPSLDWEASTVLGADDWKVELALEMLRLRRPVDMDWTLSGGSIALLEPAASSDPAVGAPSADSERDSTMCDMKARRE